MILFLLSDELIKITAVTKLHDDVEFLSLDDWLSIGDDIDVFELLEQLDLIEYIFGLLLVFISEFYLFDDIVFVLSEVAGEVGVTKGSKLMELYPCPIIFKIWYCFI